MKPIVAFMMTLVILSVSLAADGFPEKDTKRTKLQEKSENYIMSEPPDIGVPENDGARAQGYVKEFERQVPKPKRFATSYTLDKDFMNSLGSGEAVRIFNSIDGSGKDFYSFHKMKLVGNVAPDPGDYQFEPQEPRNWSLEMCSEKCLEYGGEFDAKNHTIKRTEAKKAVDNYVRSFVIRDERNSFLITYEEYRQVHDESGGESVRVYHGIDTTQRPAVRVIVIVGVAADGKSIWDRGVLVGNDTHLCPNMCDAL